MQIVTGAVSIKKIFESKWFSFLQEHRNFVRDVSINEVEKILGCRNPDAGCATYICECGTIKRIGFSCKSRFCNSCGTPASDIRINNLLLWRPKSLTYRHLTFTIPPELRGFFLRHRAALRVLEQTASQIIYYYFKEKHKLLPGTMSVIHTFGAQLNWNPHVHMVCTFGGFDKNKNYHAIRTFPYIMLIHAWKYHLLKNLKEWCYQNIPGTDCSGDVKLLNYLYNQVNDEGKEKSWYINFGKACGFLKVIVSYIGRYLKRPTIAQSRIIRYDGESVEYTYIDKYDGDQKSNTVAINDFIKLLVQHIPKRYFHMVVYRGAFSNRCKKQYLQNIEDFRDPRSNPIIPKKYAHRYFRATGVDPFICTCGQRMKLYAIIIPGYPPKYFDTS